MLKRLNRLCALAKGSVKVGKGNSVADVVLLDLLDGLGTALLADVDGLDPRLDLLLAGKLEHGKHLWAVTDVGGTEVATVWNKVLGHQLWQRLVWKTDGVELAHDLEAAEVVGHVEVLEDIGGVDDEVELELELLVPSLLVGADELLGSHLHGVVLL